MDTRLRRTTWGCVVLVVVLLSELSWVGVTKHARQARDAEAGDARAGQRQPRLAEATGKIPLHFEANTGQTDDRVKFVTRGRGYTMFLTSNEAVLALRRPEAREDKARSARRRAELPGTVSQSVLRMTYAGANPAPRIVGQEELPGKANYFKGNDPAKWRANVPTFARVRYENLYPGIDLVYYGNQRALEYDFMVQPGADPGRIALSFAGQEALEIDAEGDLLVHTAHGAIRQPKPFVYQTVDGARRQIAGRYVLADGDSVRFDVGAYDTAQTLVIDPELFYSTFLGGSADEESVAIAVDSSGSAYVTGSVTSVDFPTVGAADPTFNGIGDVFVTRLDPTGSGLVYSTYFGGGSGEVGTAIALDATGGAFVTGNTTSTDLPVTLLASDSTFNGGNDAFVFRLDASGSMLVYATYLGGSDLDLASGIAVDAGGNAYVSGLTVSADFPTTPLAFDQTLSGDNDAFVTKLNATGTALVYSTYLGGSVAGPVTEFASGIALDAAGNAYVAGSTSSSDFPTTPGAFQTISVSRDGFVTKLDATGMTLLYSTYLGGTDADEARGLSVDAAGSAYVIGTAVSADFPLMNPFQNQLGGGADAFITKLNAAGSALAYSTYLGGSDVEEGYGIAVDANGNAHVIGRTLSIDFPITAGAFQPTFGGGEDAFVTKLNPAGSALVYSSYLGGNDTDTNTGAIALDDLAEPNAYVTGTAQSPDFPTTPGAFDTTLDGVRDGYIAQIVDVDLPPGPATAEVRGQGTVLADGDEARFHILVRQTNGTISGRVQYRKKATDLKMKSETITSLVIAGNTAEIDGTCGTLCSFHVEVEDVDDSGTNDTFTISINGGPPEGGTLQKGDIKIQQ